MTTQEEIEELKKRVAILESRSYSVRAVPPDFQDVTGKSPELTVTPDSRIMEIWNDPNVRRIIQLVILALAIVWGIWVSIRGY